MPSRVGSEMCIRDSAPPIQRKPESGTRRQFFFGRPSILASHLPVMATMNDGVLVPVQYQVRKNYHEPPSRWRQKTIGQNNRKTNRDKKTMREKQNRKNPPRKQQKNKKPTTKTEKHNINTQAQNTSLTYTFTHTYTHTRIQHIQANMLGDCGLTP